MKRTFQPSRTKRVRTFGFRSRMETKDGQNVIKRRRRKQRTKLSASDENKPYAVKARIKNRNLKFISNGKEVTIKAKARLKRKRLKRRLKTQKHDSK